MVQFCLSQEVKSFSIIVSMVFMKGRNLDFWSIFLVAAIYLYLQLGGLLYLVNWDT